MLTPDLCQHQRRARALNVHNPVCATWRSQWPPKNSPQLQLHPVVTQVYPQQRKPVLRESLRQMQAVIR